MYDTKWISVTEELPFEYEYVLISYIDAINPKIRYIPSIGMYRNCSWTTKESIAEPASRQGDFEKNYNVKVTHWMFLPKSPN